jgi:hypothetical protein
LNIILAQLSMMGGLFTPISTGAIIIVAYITQSGFTAYMTRNLLLVSKYKERAAPSAGKDQLAFDTARSRDQYI